MEATTSSYFIDIATTPKRPETLTGGEGMNDKHQVVEEPCELETLTHGSEAEPGW